LAQVFWLEGVVRHPCAMHATSATVEAMCKSRPPRITLEQSPPAAEMRREPAGPTLCYEDLPEVMLGASSKPAGHCKDMEKASIDASEAWDLCVEDTLEEEDQAVDSSGDSCRAATSAGPGIGVRSGHLTPVHLSGSGWPSLPEALDDFVDCETSSLSSWLDIGEPDLAFDEESGAVLVRPEGAKPLTWAQRAKQLGGGPSSKPRGVPIPPLVRVPANKASLQVLATVGEDAELDDLERRRLCPEVSRGATQRRRKR